MDKDLRKRQGEGLEGTRRDAAEATEQGKGATGAEMSETKSEEQAVRALCEGLELLEQAAQVPTPSAAWFEQQIAAAQSKRLSRLMRDLLILWIGALFVFYVFYMTITARPAAFLSIQAAAILIPLAWLFFRKQVTSHDDN